MKQEKAFLKVWAIMVFAVFFVSCFRKQANVRDEIAHPVILEIISKDTSGATGSRLQSFVKGNGELFRWKEHYIIYGQEEEISAIKDSVQNVFSEAEIKLYNDLYYNFNRKYCPDTTTAKEWDNIIFTANLVEDTVMQQEYMGYHKTQFEEWPEVPLGFCNASFQQLIMFRNGRQLMLVISIPKGKSLDELNPKTTENNPRVDEWNRRMAKYQEGIEGADAGEVWAFFERYENCVLRIEI